LTPRLLDSFQREWALD